MVSFRVAGVSFRKDAVEKVNVGDVILLQPEPENEYDPNAIVVLWQGNGSGDECEKIGYVPKDLTGYISEMLPCNAIVESCGNAKSGIKGVSVSILD